MLMLASTGLPITVFHGLFQGFRYTFKCFKIYLGYFHPSKTKNKFDPKAKILKVANESYCCVINNISLSQFKKIMHRKYLISGLALASVIYFVFSGTFSE